MFFLQLSNVVLHLVFLGRTVSAAPNNTVYQPKEPVFEPPPTDIISPLLMAHLRNIGRINHIQGLRSMYQSPAGWNRRQVPEPSRRAWTTVDLPSHAWNRFTVNLAQSSSAFG